MIKNFILRHTTIPLLAKGLDVYSLRQKVIAANIANVNTPGYRRRQVRFEEQLQSALQHVLAGKRTHPRHFPIGRMRPLEVEPEIKEDPDTTLYSGVNNVDIEKEIVEQLKNEIRYAFGTRLIAGNFAAIRASIKGRFEP